MGDLIGGPMSTGIGAGFADEGGGLQSAMQQTIMGAVNGLSLPSIGFTGSASVAASGGAAAMGGVHFHENAIVINGDVDSSDRVRELAYQVAKEIGKRQR